MRSGGHRGRPLAALALVYLLLTVPLLLSGRGGTSEAYDQDVHHLPAIRQLAEQWPDVDWSGLPIAMSPGYHLLHAGVLRSGFGSELTLRALNCLLSFGLVLVALGHAQRWIPASRAALALAPLLFSSYFLGSAIWLNTDNAALTLALLALGGAALLPASTPRALLLGLYAAGAVGVRQIYVWLTAPLSWAAFRYRRERAPILGLCLAALAPFALLAVLVATWGGLVPPGDAELHRAGWNPATAPFVLSLVGAFGIFYLPAITPRLGTRPWRGRPLWIALGTGLLLALVWPTTWSAEAGRYGGSLWRLVRLGPDLADRSLVLVALAPLGAAVLWCFWRAAKDAGRGAEAIGLGVAIAAWVAAQSADTQCFQRYLEPMVLVLLAWGAALACRPEDGRWVAGPAVLGALQLALSAWAVYAAALL